MIARAAAVLLLCTGLVAFASALSAQQPPRNVLVSRQLAARANLHIGDSVTFAADAQGSRAATFRVAGIYEPTPDPMRFTSPRIEARMHLPEVLDLAADPADPDARETLSGINVTLTDPSDARTFPSELAARAPGVIAQPTRPARDEDPFAVLERFHLAISAVTMLGGTAFLLALMVIRAEERRETIGVLRLVGISRRTLLWSVAIEGVFIAALGAIFGVLLAVATEGLVNRIFQARYDTALVFVRVTPSIAARAVAVAAPLGVVAGLGASWTLLRRSILSIVRR
jgi:ABC-type lipoprotein release transport system permease subunit